MEITVTIPDELAARVQARGFALDNYVRELVEESLSQEQAATGSQLQNPEQRSVEETVERIRALRRGNRLDGLSVQDLIREGRKY